MNNKTLYLWDMANTLFQEEWDKNKTGFNSYDEWVEHETGKKVTELSDREYENMYNMPYQEGWYFNLRLQEGFKEVLSWTKYNEAFTTGIPEHIVYRSKYLNPKVGFDILKYFQKINSTFDFGETNDKTEEMFLTILENKYKEGFKTVVYTDDKIANVEFFKQVAKKVKDKHEDFNYRVYHILNDNKGLRDKDWYWEIGGLDNLLENEKKVNK